jgi:hypothetical protein
MAVGIGFFEEMPSDSRRNLTYNMLWTNKSFEYMFQLEQQGPQVAFVSQIFKEYKGNSLKRSKCLLELINNFTRSSLEGGTGNQGPKKSSNYYEIVAEIQESSNYSGYSQYSFVSKK